MSDPLARARAAIRQAEAILVTAGAGMGVDSGLPDFRGPEGFWRAYPAYAALGLRFEQLAHPRWFRDDPTLAWGFYGHRLELYRATTPHAGFEALRRLLRRAPRGGFVFTSNVDGHFQRAGFADDAIVECHGALSHLQCLADCGVGLWDAADVRVRVDPRTFRAAEPLPRCPRCGALARPNVLMFGDGAWDEARTAAQEARFARWLASVRGARLVVVECGAGTAVPTVRLTGEQVARRAGGVLIRINPREAEGGDIALPMGARDALLRVAEDTPA